MQQSQVSRFGGSEMGVFFAPVKPLSHPCRPLVHFLGPFSTSNNTYSCHTPLYLELASSHHLKMVLTTNIATFADFRSTIRFCSTNFQYCSWKNMESRIQEAVNHIRRFPDAKIATVAKEFGVPRNRLRYRLEGQSPKNGQPAANTKLSRAEESALCRYIDRLDRINLAVRPEFVTDAANYILRERTSQSQAGDPLLVGPNWTTRFLTRHKCSKRLQKKLHADRQASEDLSRVAKYFQKLSDICERDGILPDDTWNMDETGFRIGVGKDQLIVTKRKRAHYFGILENRESATAIEAISAGGQYIPAFLILAGQVSYGAMVYATRITPRHGYHPDPNRLYERPSGLRMA